MISMKKVASAVGGKTARACDSCIKKRARWYCAADDAFLCQACDSSVHFANLLACRHERVRLKTASTEPAAASSVEPLWHRGFKTKPRTPRKSKLKSVEKNMIHLVVPEMGQDENYLEANDEHEQLLYQVPILETFADHLCLPERDGSDSKKRAGNDEDGKYLSGTGVYNRTCNKDVNSLCGLCTDQSNMDIEEFAADVENLFRKGLDVDSFDMETLGFLGKYSHESCTSIETVKVEDEETREFNMGDIAQIDITAAETFELNFDDNCEEDIKAEGVTEKEELNYDDDLKVKKKNKLLGLDYEGVISAWADKKTPWMIGDGRPELDLIHCWPDCMDEFGKAIYEGSSRNNITAAAAATTTTDSGREARVLRYREKRRRRLFSKTIRYEVRKLNAEKRPRIKGRFVRRPTNMAPN